MIERKNYDYSVVCAVIDRHDVPAIAALFPDEESRAKVIYNARPFLRDGRPIVASLRFENNGYTYLDFGYRYGSLTPGDGGVVTYFENWMEKTDEGCDKNGVRLYSIAEQVCFRSFIRMVEIADKTRLKFLQDSKPHLTCRTKY